VPHKELTPTTIRQSVIAQKLKAGENLRKVQAFAGQSKVPTTENTNKRSWKSCAAPWPTSIL